MRLTGGQHPHPFPELVPGSALRLAGVELTNAALLALALAVVFTLLADQFLRRTRTGLHLRALAERPLAAELLGVRVRRLSLLVWGVTGAVTTLAIRPIVPATGTIANGNGNPPWSGSARAATTNMTLVTISDVRRLSGHAQHHDPP